MIKKESYDSVFWYPVYQARPETRRTGSASLAIPMLFLVLPDKLDIKRHQHGFLYILYYQKDQRYSDTNTKVEGKSILCQGKSTLSFSSVLMRSSPLKRQTKLQQTTF